MTPQWWDYKDQPMPDGWYYLSDTKDPDDIRHTTYIARHKDGTLRSGPTSGNIFYGSGGYDMGCSGGGFVWGPLPLPSKL